MLTMLHKEALSDTQPCASSAQGFLVFYEITTFLLTGTVPYYQNHLIQKESTND